MYGQGLLDMLHTAVVAGKQASGRCFQVGAAEGGGGTLLLRIPRWQRDQTMRWTEGRVPGAGRSV